MKDTLQRPSFSTALRFWCKLGWISFGGTAAHIAIMHDELVEKKRWISNRVFLHRNRLLDSLVSETIKQLDAAIEWGTAEESQTNATDEATEIPAEPDEEIPQADPIQANLLDRLLYKGVLSRYTFPKLPLAVQINNWGASARQ